MEKKQIDELYHLLRVASNDWVKESPLDKPQSDELISVVYGLSRHLLAGGYYLALVQYLAWYGRQFLVKPATQLLKDCESEFDRIVELGAGLGWLGRGLAAEFGYPPTMFIDKRDWMLIDLIVDLETTDGREKVISVLKPGDLLVMSELLHCLEDPVTCLEPFSKWPKLIIEYCPTNTEYMKSYATQINRFGGKFIEPEAMAKLIETLGEGKAADADPHVIVYIPPKV